MMYLINLKIKAIDTMDDTWKHSHEPRYYCSAVKITNDKYGYFAERLHKAMKGWGTDDSELIRVIVSRSEVRVELIQRWQN